MYCKKCGKDISTQEKCPFCGTEQSYKNPFQMAGDLEPHKKPNVDISADSTKKSTLKEDFFHPMDHFESKDNAPHNWNQHKNVDYFKPLDELELQVNKQPVIPDSQKDPNFNWQKWAVIGAGIIVIILLGANLLSANQESNMTSSKNTTYQGNSITSNKNTTHQEHTEITESIQTETTAPKNDPTPHDSRLADGEYYGLLNTWDTGSAKVELLEYDGRGVQSYNYVLNPTGEVLTLDISQASVWLEWAWGETGSDIKCTSIDAALDTQIWGGGTTVRENCTMEIYFTVKNGIVTKIVILYAA